MNIRPYRNIERRKSRKIKVGNVFVGGDSPITVQTMTNTLTTDINATMKQIEESVEAELANAIDEEIANAVAQGIDEAAVTAGWEAYFEVIAAGGTAEEASAKAYETCGSACDNY